MNFNKEFKWIECCDFFSTCVFILVVLLVIHVYIFYCRFFPESI